MTTKIQDQPAPIQNNAHPDVADMAIADARIFFANWEVPLALFVKDMEERKNLGISRYGVALKPFNGRDPIVDLYQELLDAIVYCKQTLYEIEHTENHPLTIKYEAMGLHYKRLMDFAVILRFWMETN